MANHIVNRQVFDISLRSPSQSKGVQEVIDRLNKEKLLPLADEIFNKLDDKDRHIRLEKVEIDLGIISIEDFEEKFRSVLFDSLSKKLSNNLYAETIEAERERRVPQIQSDVDQKLEIIRHFLLSGQLPWWTNRKDFRFDAVLFELLSSCPVRILQLLRDIWIDTVALRLFYQLSESSISQLFKSVIEHSQFEPDAVGKFLDELSNASEIPNPFRKKIRKDIIQVILSGRINHDSPSTAILSALEGNILQILDKQWKNPEEKFTEILYQAGIDSGEIRKIIQKVEFPNKRRDNSETETQKESKRKNEKTDLSDPVEHLGEKTEKKDIPKMADTKNSEDKPEIRDIIKDKIQKEKSRIIRDIKEQGIYVENAGMVILWPFVKEFFEKTSLVKNDHFLTGKSREKATLLLQYLVTGTLDIKEHELALNKLLCGCPLDEPIDISLKISEKEKSLADELIQNVISQWRALGKISIQGLRQSFLTREGILKEIDLGWQLKISRQSYDLLLDRLPWSYGIVKFKWMNKPLFVEW